MRKKSPCGTEKVSAHYRKSFRTLREKKEERKKKHRKELDKQPIGNLEVT
jgi:hypothetical protein